MLTITIGAKEGFDEKTSQFVKLTKGTEVTFEHSLVSLSKWESKYTRPFLSAGDKTESEILDYIQMMVVTPNVPLYSIGELTQKNLDDLNAYIVSPQTATTFKEDSSGGHKGPKEIITAELIYYWMVGHQIPFECQYWHINRLLTLIRVCNVKNSKPKKMSKAEIAAHNREVNARRRAELGTRG